VKIEKLIEVTNKLEETLDELGEAGFAVSWVRVRIQDQPVIDVTVDIDQNVTVNPQSKF